MADWAGGQCSPSVLPFTEYSGVLPSVMSRVRRTSSSSASYSKNSSVASKTEKLCFKTEEEPHPEEN